MPDHIPQDEAQVFDDTVQIDYDTLEALQDRLDQMDRGVEAARARHEMARANTRSVGTRSLDGNDAELMDIDISDIGEVVEIAEEDELVDIPAFSVVDMSDVFFDEEIVDIEVSDFEAEVVKPKLDLSKIVQEPLSELEYYPNTHEKRQIYLHHTVSPGDPMISIRWWRQDRNSRGNRIRVATFVVISGRKRSAASKYTDGEIYQCFSSKHWAHHLGVSSNGNRGKIANKYRTQSHNVQLNKNAIGIELASWGPLHPLQNGNYAPVDHYKDVFKKTGSEAGIKFQIPASRVIEYPNKYRGFRFYERYTGAQIESTRQLLVYLCEKYDIPKTYDEGIWDLHEPALRGDKGIFTHTSVRADKSDCHPQPELVAMLKGL